MTDLINRLRNHAAIADKTGRPHCNLLHEAADRIAELERRLTEADADLDQALQQRDRAQDALLEASDAMGGPEWCVKIPPEPAPDSGDLHEDVPELCRRLMTEVERLRALLSAQQVPTQAKDARDAARYRWLRSVSIDTAEEYCVCDDSMNIIVGEELDAAIDAAMQVPQETDK